MATLLDKQRSATGKVQGPDETPLDQVLSRIAALAPMVARLAPDMEQDSVAAAVRLLTRPSMQFCVRMADPLASR